MPRIERRSREIIALLQRKAAVNSMGDLRIVNSALGRDARVTAELNSPHDGAHAGW